MRRLAGTDALFLSMETPSWHQHVAGLTLLDPAGCDISFDSVVKQIDDRLSYAPKFKWKVQEVPFGLDRPVWVDDADFDVLRHVRRVAVPSPGGPRELGELVGTLSSMQLDRRWPLWELWYIEGLAGGKLAVMLKYHHCLLDGMAGASLATVLLDLEPDATEPWVQPLPPEDLIAGPEESGLSLLAEVFRPDLRRPYEFARFVTGMAAKTITALDSFRTDENTRAVLSRPATPINGSVGPRRELAFASVSLTDVIALKDKHGVKVNDVVVAVCAGALRRYLERLDALPDASLVTAVPISTRPKGDRSHSNQVTTMFVKMATDVDDPVERLQAIACATASTKAMSRAMGAHEIQSIGEVAAPIVLSAAIKGVYRSHLIPRIPAVANTLVSSVPGPPVPVYLCGARVTAIYPSSILVDGTGLNITVMSYEDRLDFGLNVDPDIMSDPWFLAGAFADAIDELRDASGLTATPVADPFA